MYEMNYDLHKIHLSNNNDNVKNKKITVILIIKNKSNVDNKK